MLLRHKDIDFFSITETHLSSHISDDEIGIQGYTIYRLDRQAQSKGGGVGVYVRDCVSVSRRFDLESNSIEGIWLGILIAKSKIILFGSLYRPPFGSQFISADFNATLEDTQGLAMAENKEILLVGDLNATFLPRQSIDRISRDLKDLLQLINDPTSITELELTTSKILNSSFWKSKILNSKILNSGFWQSKIVNSGFWKLNSNSTT